MAKLIATEEVIIQRNDAIKNWVEKTFNNDHDRAICWMMIEQLCRMYPEWEQTFRGRIIFKGK